MKPNIHPQYYTDAKVTCACGATWTTGSTLKEIRTEICSSCHPFYTGKTNLVDTLGRVDKFRKKQALKKDDAASKPKAVRKTTGLTHTQVKAAMRGQKAVKVKQVVGKDKKDDKKKA